MAGRVRIGISGWTYPPWRGKFYPSGLAQNQELRYAASRFSSVEINGTFYSLQRPTSFARWCEQTPAGFVFSIKGSRYITHMLKLRGVEGALANFFASGLLRLGPKLGPILWQFSPNFSFQADRLEFFLEMLPRDMDGAARWASRHDARLQGRAWTDPGPEPGRALRYAIEVRHPSFRSQEFLRLLRRYNVALVCADAVDWPRWMDLTADFAYCRLHGSEVLYTSGYSAESLDEWAARAVAWARGQESPNGERVSAEPGPRRGSRDVYVYFDNDVKAYAPRDAQALEERVCDQLQTTCWQAELPPWRPATRASIAHTPEG